VISICSLIYRSTRYADAVWESAHEFTPALHNGGARFFFVANDATDQVLAHLIAKRYPHVVQTNERLTEYQIDVMGFAPPEYIRRVYQGWNRAICESDDVLVLVNSDCMFSPEWFEPLIENLTPQRVVCSKLVERKHPKHDPFEAAIHGEFGDHPDRFDKAGFLNFCDLLRSDYLEHGGAYMPCAMHKQTAIDAGYYPEGNPFGSCGDANLFARMRMNGVEHVTARASLVYHFKEGEMDE
jgi:hypothetical protein